MLIEESESSSCLHWHFLSWTFPKERQQPTWLNLLTCSHETHSERQVHTMPILEELDERMTILQLISSSLLGKAIKYTFVQWPKLIRYINDGHLPIEYNPAEHTIKPLVIGRIIGCSRKLKW